MEAQNDQRNKTLKVMAKLMDFKKEKRRKASSV